MRILDCRFASNRHNEAWLCISKSFWDIDLSPDQKAVSPGEWGKFSPGASASQPHSLAAINAFV
jgi:hypothetical protein